VYVPFEVRKWNINSVTKRKEMEKIKLIITENDSKYAQCNFCLSRDNVIDVKGDRLSTVMSLCKDCIKKINDKVK